ncbi:MAG TPA: cytidine deaminase [Candidatus Dietzia intestinigallinarum]|nr:cytidine deaminase [Candidatus Dietzia intestinigallinarum]
MYGDETAAQRTVDPDRLREIALEAAHGAYRPYSGLGVGAAATAVMPVSASDASAVPSGSAATAVPSGVGSAPGRPGTTDVSDGRVRIVTGCNVENASYGLTLCAECSLVSDLYRTGGGRLLDVVVVAHTGEPLAPCGRCRQLLHEHGGPDLVVHGARGPVRLATLLPDAFGPQDLA